MQGQVDCDRAVTIKEKCFNGRGRIEVLKQIVFSMKHDSCFDSEQKYLDQHSEMKANIMLAYRHLEDARMRLGKVIQAHDDDTSVDPK